MLGWCALIVFVAGTDIGGRGLAGTGADVNSVPCHQSGNRGNKVFIYQAPSLRLEISIKRKLLD
uniref:Secreted protein n=1 Tax=Echinococcus granulosus TaxID=6210 RepID=A0A068WFJ4_ECHGR|nr:hypothetical protein EgrG_000992800 [Echinococcus granulosus]